VLGFLQQVAHERDQRLTDLVQFDTAPDAVEQLRGETVLQRLDLAADSRLGDLQEAARFGEILGLRSHQKNLQLV